ncbi:GntP family permease [Natranaerobius trueperi]|uniref:Citrate transporter n=1 Tax=Natranaerobius trueperi TaxID=759412 RepID=A0A226BYH5_9FIRM|nr:GntP family permease [Natranaerobius trueperi]OWZ84063.1 citrate transporter [Natranaerobius trueperi]
MWIILAGIILLIVLVYNRINVVIAAPIAVSFVSILNGYAPFDVLTGEYVEETSYFIKDFLFIFLLGAIMGKIMTDSGATQTISLFIVKTLGAKRGISAVLISSALLTYGGIPGFVVVFTIYPISLPVFKEANLPRYLLPACFMGGVANLSIPMPGSPQIHNIIPMESLETGPLAGLIPGVIGTIVSLTLAILYLEFRAKRSKTNGESFQDSEQLDEKLLTSNPSIITSLIPLIIVVTSLSFFNISIIAALTLGVLVAIILFFKYLTSTINSINNGVKDSLPPLLFAASAVGFGLTLRSFPDFEAFLQAIIDLPVNPLITSALTTNLGASIMGSASGGIVLTMSLIEEGLIAQPDGANLHRIIVMSSTVFDTIPFNNGYLGILAFIGLSVKDTYFDCFMTTIVTPLIGLMVAFGLMLL